MTETYFQTITTDKDVDIITRFVCDYPELCLFNFEQEIYYNMNTFIQEHYGYGNDQEDEINSHQLIETAETNNNCTIHYQVDEYSIIWALTQTREEETNTKKFLVLARIVENGLPIKNVYKIPQFVFKLYSHVDNIKNNIKEYIDIMNEESLREMIYDSNIEYVRDNLC